MGRIGATFIACLLATSVSAAEWLARFDSPIAGFHVVKPAGWSFLTAEQNIAAVKGLQFSDKELQEAWEKYTTAPLVAMAKYPEPFADVNPSFKVNIKPFGLFKGKDAKEIAAAILSVLQRALKDIEVVQPASDVTVSGLKGAYMRLNYTAQMEGRQVAGTSELWIVPRGDYFFMMGAGTRPDEKTGTRAEIQKIVATVRIDPPKARALITVD
ncbi:MAG TPA: hypothetical protein VKP67_21020 [Xanthobacteraceae bacterium]|nr:hypothetical protein [Xanthobacteraceae bacterium]